MSTTTASPRILLVEDDPDTAALIQETLTDAFGGSGCDCVANVAQAVAQDPAHYDLILSDMNLPDGSGLDVMTHLLQRRPDLPIVLVTAEGKLDNAMRAIRHGAYDYVVKAGDYLFSIPVIVEKNLAIWRTKRENQRLQEQLEQTLADLQVKNQQLEEAVSQLESMAATDALTALANRRAFNSAVDRAFAEARRYGRDLACLMIDLDGFKAVNDLLGHQRGDDLLQLAGRVLQANCRRSDIAARYGGDEFVVLMPQTDAPTARTVARRIAVEFIDTAHRLLATEPPAAPTPEVTMSMGLATLAQSRPIDADQLIAHADHALYRAKQAGKTRLVLYDGMNATPETLSNSQMTSDPRR